MNNRNFQYENALIINMIKNRMDRSTILDLSEYLSALNNTNTLKNESAKEELLNNHNQIDQKQLENDKNIDDTNQQLDNISAEIYKLSDKEVLVGSTKIFLKYSTDVYIKPNKLYMTNDTFHQNGKLHKSSAVVKCFFSVRNKYTDSDNGTSRFRLNYYIDTDGSIVIFEDQSSLPQTSISISEINEPQYRNLKMEYYINRENNVLKFLKLVPTKESLPTLSFKSISEHLSYNECINKLTLYTRFSCTRAFKSLFHEADIFSINCAIINKNDPACLHFTNRDLVDLNKYEIVGLLTVTKSHKIINIYFRFDHNLHKKYNLSFKKFFMYRSSEIKNAFYIKLNEGVEYKND